MRAMTLHIAADAPNLCPSRRTHTRTVSSHWANASDFSVEKMSPHRVRCDGRSVWLRFLHFRHARNWKIIYLWVNESHSCMPHSVENCKFIKSAEWRHEDWRACASSRRRPPSACSCHSVAEHSCSPLKIILFIISILVPLIDFSLKRIPTAIHGQKNTNKWKKKRKEISVVRRACLFAMPTTHVHSFNSLTYAVRSICSSLRYNCFVSISFHFSSPSCVRCVCCVSLCCSCGDEE